MKPKFVANTRVSIEGLRMLVRCAYGKKLRTRIVTAGAVSVLAAAFLILSPQKTIAIVLLALALAFLSFFLRSNRRMAEKLMKALPNQALVTELKFTDERIDTHNDEEDGFIQYKAIVRQWMDKDFFAFMLDNGSAMVVAKKDFVTGDLDKFPGFLYKKTGKQVWEIGKWF